MLNNYGEVLENASLENYNTYGIKSSCKYLIKPSSISNLVNLISYLKKNNINYYLLGKGSNVILPDNMFDGVIISLELLNNITFDNNKVYAEAGCLLSKLAMESINNNLSGLEYIALIPGTLGGALYGNAGVKGHTIYDCVKSVLVIHENELLELSKDEIDISYRNTSFKHNDDIIVSVNLELTNGIKEEMINIINENRIKRMNSQPLKYKNAGSVFKNPEGNYAGKLIEEVGLKGYSIGDAEVSNIHANFIVNNGNATSKDIKDLINYIKEKVKEKYDIDLELEQIIVEW
jgi:UDP-N-acetylmuramate dehydrogenase